MDVKHWYSLLVGPAIMREVIGPHTVSLFLGKGGKADSEVFSATCWIPLLIFSSGKNIYKKIIFEKKKNLICDL